MLWLQTKYKKINKSTKNTVMSTDIYQIITEERSLWSKRESCEEHLMQLMVIL